MLAGTNIEATFVPADPYREGWLGLWSHSGDIADADSRLELVLPAGSRVRRRTVPVRRLPIAQALDDLICGDIGPGPSPSLTAWATVASLAIDLVARGRLTPALSSGGHDVWRLGPLDPDDVERLSMMAEALPTESYAMVVPGVSPLHLPSPQTIVGEFCNAVADVLPRTSAASTAAGAAPFASWSSSPLDGVESWLETLAGADDEAALALRLQPPNDASLDPDEPAGQFRATLVLHSRTDPSLTVEAADLWDAPDVVLSRLGDAENALLLGLRRGQRVWSPLRRLLDDALPTELLLDDGEVTDLLGPVVDDLASAGIQVHWPAELVTELTVRPTVTTPAPAALTSAGFSLESMVELRWKASIDDEELTEDEMTELVDAKRPLVRLRGRWVRADPERLHRLRTRRNIGAGAALAAALDGHLEVDGETVEASVEGILADLAMRLKDHDPRREHVEPDMLEATLRPYQKRGLAWLAEMADLGLGGILADDMGLGKTIQLLGLHLERNGPTLVLCPASLIGNWERESNRFSPMVPVRRYHGQARTLTDLSPSEIVLTTYGVARRDAELLGRVAWDLVVADEAQAIKNPLSRTARTLRTLPARARFALTGTPVENRLSELWAILDWTTPGLLGPLATFRRRVAVPIERHRDPEATASLAAIVAPFVLRRRKSDPTVAPEIPPKTETDRLVPLTSEQATLYRAVAEELLDQISDSEAIARRGLVLKLLTALKQICNHPAQYLGQQGPLMRRSGKLDGVTELVDVIAAEGDAALMFTQYVAMGRLLENHLAERGLRCLFLHGSVPIGRRQEMVDRFQAGEADVFVISLKAGGTGLNLTKATHVVHYDRWWNPAVEDQASDRAWRIGQDRPVQVHRMVCEGTVEDRIATVLEDKRALAEAVVGGGESWITELDDVDLANLVSLSSGVDDATS